GSAGSAGSEWPLHRLAGTEGLYELRVRGAPEGIAEGGRPRLPVAKGHRFHLAICLEAGALPQMAPFLTGLAGGPSPEGHMDGAGGDFLGELRLLPVCMPVSQDHSHIKGGRRHAAAPCLLGSTVTFHGSDRPLHVLEDAPEIGPPLLRTLLDRRDEGFN